jgi:hypothetical protein
LRLFTRYVLFMLRPLQIFHLGLVFLIPVIFALLKLSADDYDPIIILTNKISIVLGVVWTSYFTIELLRTDANDNIKPTVLKKYRTLIAKNTRFLFISDILLLIILCILGYQILAFRSVEFIATKNTELFESKLDGSIEKVGDISPNKITSFRVKSGIKLFVFRDPAKEEYTSLEPVDVPSFFSSKKIKRIKLIQDENFQLLK